MIVIVIFLLFSLYMYWQFENRRKSRNIKHQREKQEALADLLTKIKRNTDNNDTKTEI